MHSIRLLTISSCLLLLGSPVGSAYADGTTSPGKNSAFASVSFMMLPAYSSPLLTATIEKGKKKTVLEIVTTLSATPAAPVTLASNVTVNGIQAQPGLWTVAQDCSANAALGCQLTDVRWIDVDAAEAANPGMFVGQPLVVNFTGGAFMAGIGSNSAATLAVRVQKK